MGKLIDGDDGLPAEEVGEWAKKKHHYLRNYLYCSRGARKKFLKGKSESATYIDLFCGSGRARVRETGEWIDGSAVVAWKTSQESKTAFSKMYIADIDNERRKTTAERLLRLGAPVQELDGPAIDAAAEFPGIVNPYGLHFAFIDPYALRTLDFKIIQSLSRLKRIDMLVHLSKMDHQRNLEINLKSDESALDAFVPGWRDRIGGNRPLREIRRQIIEYWCELVKETGKNPSPDRKLITGSRGQTLYWLLLIAKHDLAQKFWKISTDDGQGSLFES